MFKEGKTGGGKGGEFKLGKIGVFKLEYDGCDNADDGGGQTASIVGYFWWW